MKKILLSIITVTSLFSGELSSYISHDLILKTDENQNTYIENVEKITFKSGFSVNYCIITDRTDSSVKIICTGDGSKNVFTELQNVSVSSDKIKLNTKYYNWYEIKISEILKDFQATGEK